MWQILVDVWIVAGLAVASATLPGTMELLFLTLGGVLPAKRRTSLAPVDRPSRIAFVVPAHNEEAAIANCVKSLHQCHSHTRTPAVFVIADNCTDQTAALAQQAGATVLTRTDAEQRGKGYALDFAFQTLLARGFDYFIIVDADSSVTFNLLHEFELAFASGAVAVQCRYKVRNAEDSMRTRWMNIALMAFNVLRPRGRDRFGASVGILGNGFGLSRSALETVPYHAVSVVEDLEYHIRLVRAGLKVGFIDAATVFGEMPSGGAGVSTQRARWEGGRFRMIRQFVPTLARDVARGQFRLLEPMLELLLLPLGFHVLMLLAAASTPLLAIRLYSACALAVVGLHLLCAIAMGGGGWRDVSALLSAPFYLIWKLRIIPRLLRNASGSAAWVRTERQPLKGAHK